MPLCIWYKLMLFIAFGTIPAGHVYAAVFSDSNKYVGYRDVGLSRQPPVEEIRVGFPNVFEKCVAESDLCDVVKVKLQALVIPALSEVALEGVGLQGVQRCMHVYTEKTFVQ